MADPQLPLADETATEARIQENPVEKPTSAIKFAERKTVVYDELDHPELDLASLDKAYDKLDGEEHSTFPELEYLVRCMEPISLPKEMGAFISLTSTRPKSESNTKNIGKSIGDVDGSQQTTAGALYL